MYLLYYQHHFDTKYLLRKQNTKLTEYHLINNVLLQIALNADNEFTADINLRLLEFTVCWQLDK